MILPKKNVVSPGLSTSCPYSPDKLCSALELSEIELAIARTADSLQKAEAPNVGYLENLGHVLVRYRKARLAGVASRRLLKRLSLWHSAGKSRMLDFAVEVMHSVRIDGTSLSNLPQDELDHIIALNGR